MSEFKHTSEPWFPVNYGGYINIQDTEVYGNRDIFNEEDCEEAIANAKIASCAPELLKALRSLMESYDKYGNLLNFNVDIARQAIKRATTL